MLLLSILGATDESIIYDYALTEHAGEDFQTFNYELAILIDPFISIFQFAVLSFVSPDFLRNSLWRPKTPRGIHWRSFGAVGDRLMAIWIT